MSTHPAFFVMTDDVETIRALRHLVTLASGEPGRFDEDQEDVKVLPGVVVVSACSTLCPGSIEAMDRPAEAAIDDLVTEWVLWGGFVSALLTIAARSGAAVYPTICDATEMLDGPFLARIMEYRLPLSLTAITERIATI